MTIIARFNFPIHPKLGDMFVFNPDQDRLWVKEQSIQIISRCSPIFIDYRTMSEYLIYSCFIINKGNKYMEDIRLEATFPSDLLKLYKKREDQTQQTFIPNNEIS